MFATLIAGAALVQDAPEFADAKVIEASLFKNGYAVVLREVEADADGETWIAEPPVAVLGTIWIGASDGTTLESVVASTVERATTRPAGSVHDLLVANIGKTLLFQIAKPGDELEQLVAELQAVGPDYVIVEFDGAERMRYISHIRAFASPEGEIIRTAPGPETQARALRITSRGGGKIYILAMQQGLTWSPAYRLDISDPEALRLTSKATIINDLVDLDSTLTRLVTGFPHVRFLNQLDPLTSGERLDTYVGKAMEFSRRMAPASADSMLTQAEGGVNYTPFDPSAMPGTQAEDLFFYNLPGVSLKIGERGYYILFQAESKYRHIYTLDIPASYIMVGRNVGQPDPDPSVWHNVEFTNNTEQPLTTGPALTVQNDLVLGQDVLEYTPIGAKALVKITKAMDVKVEQKEEMIGRQINALQIEDGPSYHLITARGKVEIVNYKSTTITLRVNKEIVGEATDADHGGEITVLPVGLNDINPHSRIEWEFELEPGGRVTLTYTYKVYSRI